MNTTIKPFPEKIKEFIQKTPWIFAKTYAKTWPHEYLVKEKVDVELFFEMVNHIRQSGYDGRFYNVTIRYFEEDGMVYWTMVPPEGHPRWYPPEQETIINRCPKESTYEERLKRGDLPE